MPDGMGTYGKKVGRPKKSKCMSCKTKSKAKTSSSSMSYRSFMAKHRKMGKSMKEIGAAWSKMKK